MASALERCYDKQAHFRKQISVEEHRAQKETDFSEGDTLLILSMNIFDLLDPLMKFKDCRECSVLNWRTTTFRILT